MEQSVNEAWKRLLDEARRELPEATVRTWLQPSEPTALDDGRLILGAPDQFAAEWNESKHASLLARAAERVLGKPTTVVFRVQEDRQRRPQMDFFVAPREPAAAATAPAAPQTVPGQPDRGVLPRAGSPTPPPPDGLLRRAARPRRGRDRHRVRRD